jgi:hypothetical protein
VNTVAPGGIQLSGVSISSRVTDNYFQNIGQNNTANSNFIGAIDTYTDADESIISENVCIDSYIGPLKLQNARNLSCNGNVVRGYSGPDGFAMIIVQNARSFASELQNITVNGNVVDIEGDTVNQCMTIDGQAGGAYDTRYVSVNGNVLRGGDEGIRLKQFDKVSIVGNIIEGTGTHGIEANEMGDDGPHVNISANTFANIGGIAVYFPSSNNSDNLNISVTGNLLDGTSGTPTSFCQIRGESGFALERVIVSNNLIKGNCSSADIDIQWADTAVVTGNISDGNSDNLSAGNITTLVATANSWVETSAYTPTNVSTDRSYDADTVLVAELADVVGTLIADLQTQGVIS